LLLELEWNNLSDPQKDRLLPALGQAYGSFQNPLSDFIISELLGEYYCDERAFSLLLDLNKRSGTAARSLLPHGFEHIARSSSSEDLRRKALVELQRMKTDADEQVSNEANVSLERIRLNADR
jgi:hypothetical protein